MSVIAAYRFLTTAWHVGEFSSQNALDNWRLNGFNASPPTSVLFVAPSTSGVAGKTFAPAVTALGITIAADTASAKVAWGDAEVYELITLSCRANPLAMSGANVTGKLKFQSGAYSYYIGGLSQAQTYRYVVTPVATSFANNIPCAWFSFRGTYPSRIPILTADFVAEEEEE